MEEWKHVTEKSKQIVNQYYGGIHDIEQALVTAKDKWEQEKRRLKQCLQEEKIKLGNSKKDLKLLHQYLAARGCKLETALPHYFTAIAKLDPTGSGSLFAGYKKLLEEQKEKSNENTIIWQNIIEYEKFFVTRIEHCTLKVEGPVKWGTCTEYDTLSCLKSDQWYDTLRDASISYYTGKTHIDDDDVYNVNTHENILCVDTWWADYDVDVCVISKKGVN